MYKFANIPIALVVFNEYMLEYLFIYGKIAIRGCLPTLIYANE